MRFRRGGEQTGADRDAECSNEERPNEKNRRTSGCDEILARKKESGQRTDVASRNAEGDDQDHGQSGRDDHTRHERATAGIGREFLFQKIGKPIGEAFGMWEINRLGGHVCLRVYNLEAHCIQAGQRERHIITCHATTESQSSS